MLVPNRDEMKRLAAERAVEFVTDGMVLGLGTGSTASFAIELLGTRIKSGLKIKGIPTSDGSAKLAQKFGVPLTNFAEQKEIDLTIDGADQVERGSLNLIKGLGGALLREKIVASASKRMIVIVDESKLVDQLGAQTALPVEILPFACEHTIARLEQIGLNPTLRVRDGKPFKTDSGNFIADCAVKNVSDAAALEQQIDGIAGVVESGLFIGLASSVVVAGSRGVDVIEKMLGPCD